MSSSPYFIVSWLRCDGGAHETTFMGFSAETCALRFFAELKEHPKYNRCARVIERHSAQNPAHPTQPDVTFDEVASFGLEKREEL